MRKFILPLAVMTALFSNVVLAADCPSASAIALVGFNSAYPQDGFWNISYTPGHKYDTNYFWVFKMSIPDVHQDSTEAVASARKIAKGLALKFSSGDGKSESCVYYNDEYGLGGTAVSYLAKKK